MGTTRRQVTLAVAIATALSVVAVVVFDGGPAELVFMLLLLIPLMLALRHVVVAAVYAQREGREARRLAAADPGRVAAEAVAAERRRLAVDIQLAVRSSVAQMRGLAVAAVSGLPQDPRGALDVVGEHGRQAMTDLRRLLGLLREPPDPLPADDAPVAGAVRRIHRFDLVLAVVVVLDVGLWIVGTRAGLAAEPVTAVGVVLTFVLVGPALLRTVAPGIGAVVAAALVVIGTVSDRPVGSAGLADVLLFGGLIWACASTERSPLWAVTGPIALAAAVAHKHVTYLPENLPLLLTIFEAALLAGLGFRLARVRADRAAATAGSHRAQLGAAAQEALTAERRTVARELHDAVSGGVGVIVMQAGAAAALWESDQLRARRALDVVVATCDTALVELEQLLVALDGRECQGPADDADASPGTVRGRGHDGARSGAAVARGPSDLGPLLERMRTAGLDLDATLDVPSGPVVPWQGWSVAYRVVQEALTNVLRHAPGAHVQLTVRATADGLDLEVADDGPGTPTTSLRGYGLVGLSERVEQVGGTLTARPDPGGGFRVRAQLPRARDSSAGDAPARAAASATPDGEDRG